MLVLPILLTLRQCVAAAAGGVGISGTVLDAHTVRPLAGVEVRLDGTGCTRLTDRKGHFEFRQIPPGKYVIDSSLLGYAEMRDSIVVRDGSTADVEIRMAQTVVPLNPLTVTIRSPALEQLGFYQRRDNGNGAFLTRAQIEKLAGVSVPSDIVRRITGLRLVRRPGSLRGYRVVGRNSCPFRYIVDGVTTDAAFEFDDLEAQWIEGLEVYSGIGEIPPQFAVTASDGGRTCGVIVVWTRRHLSKVH